MKHLITAIFLIIFIPNLTLAQSSLKCELIESTGSKKIQVLEKELQLIAELSFEAVWSGITLEYLNSTVTIECDLPPLIQLASIYAESRGGNENIIIPATSCKAATPATSTKLQFKENGLINYEAEKSLSVVCPIKIPAAIEDQTNTNRDLFVRISGFNENQDSEGSCTNPHNAKIKESYLGDFDIPKPQNSFGEDRLKALGFKDYGVEWIYNNYALKRPDLVAGCTEEEYVKLMYRTTLRRLKKHGADTAWVYNFGYWKPNDDGEAWEINHDRKHVSDWQIEFIADTARELGMNMHYAWQFLALDDENNLLFPFNGQVYVDMSLLKRILDTHEKHMLWEADRLQQLGIASMSADWSAMFACLCGLDNEADTATRDEMKSYYAERMGSIVSQIKDRFSGEVYVGEGQIWNDSRVFNEVDGVILSLTKNMFSVGEEGDATVELMEERVSEYAKQTYDNWTCNTQQPCWEYTTYDLPPVIWNLFAQSHKMFLSTGWIEDGFCTTGNYKGVQYDECMQWHVPADFSAQAIFVEGMLRAIDKDPWFNTKGTTATTAYWLSDTLIPDEIETLGNGLEGFPNISQSVRGKPAEKIIKYWYTGEYEQYNPEYE